MLELDTQSEIDRLLGRFGGFFDAVLVGVVLDLPRRAADRQAMVRLLARERDGTWCSVLLTVAPIREFAFTEGKVSYFVLSDGLKFSLFEDGVFLDLAPVTDEPASTGQLRRSPQFVAGGECSVEVAELQATD